jgi:hypothetical protein
MDGNLRGWRGQLESCMNDAERYRMNAADCILAGARCGPAYRDLTFALAEAWLSLARQQQAMDELLVIWSKAHPTTLAAPSRQSFQYPPDLHRLVLPAPVGGGDSVSVQRGCDSPMPPPAPT